MYYITGILEKSDELMEKTGAKKLKQKADHLAEDAREAWETSQNPWVYRVSSVYDTVTAESEQTIAIRQLRELDPDFDLEEWRHMVVEELLPHIMKLFLEGKIEDMAPWLGEGVYKRIAAEVAARKQEGVEIDTHVLGIMNSEILACEVSLFCCCSCRALSTSIHPLLTM
jgi:import inner membrane translocase subunit TIM44